MFKRSHPIIFCFYSIDHPTSLITLLLPLGVLSLFIHNPTQPETNPTYNIVVSASSKRLA
jgi:hypothetical protein